MNGPRNYHMKGNKSDKNIPVYHLYEKSKKVYNELIYKRETDSQTQKISMAIKGKVRGRDKLEVSDEQNRYTP